MKKQFKVHPSVKGKKAAVKKEPKGYEELNKYEKWLNGKSKNKNLMIEFQNYCIDHPDERFWQALRNWAKVERIYATRFSEDDDDTLVEDTFYWNKKNK